MTIEQAIMQLEYCKDFATKDQIIALDIAIKALEPCEDAISRSSLLSKLDDCYKEKIKIAPDNMTEGFMQVEKLIKQELPVTSQLKIGSWIRHDTGHSIYYDCSLCGCCAPCTETADKMLWKLANYCPDCGAKMQGVKR